MAAARAAAGCEMVAVADVLHPIVISNRYGI